MVSFNHTVLVEESEGVRLSADTFWEILVGKARNPVRYVPSITAARVIEDRGDEFVREIVLRGAFTVRERVRLEPPNRIVFEQLDNPDLAVITNEIGADEAGRLTFTFGAVLSPAGLERSRREPGFIAENDLLFYDTARATVNTTLLYAELNQQLIDR
ncbi:AtaL-like protein [Kutzneria sp. NPDC051319]|uniref:AtaL-like protein n=1 Tax=Kutzneria sp. NPDC051319 TaxID=3155047 RepID=UPI00341652CC